MVYKLFKALYGLRQAPRAWNIRLDKVLKDLNFKRSPREYALYRREDQRGVLIVRVYVDDLIVTGSSAKEIENFKNQMRKNFEMSDLGQPSYYLGIEVVQQNRGIAICQEGYATKVLKNANMWDCNPTKYPMEPGLQLTNEDKTELVDPTMYKSIIGCLRYLTHTRPDINYAVGVANRFMEMPRVTHLQAVKHLLRYIKGTLSFGIQYTRNGCGKLIGYSDSSHANDRVDGKSTTGMIFYYGDGSFAWSG
ncbi:hypothetical protein E3N88_04826 [Mikania micrantha]|uniref:Reverse transcriptase Ty1/copia-type domain-containing protein n=1 Tax=Mikania micrantha TaxID=192012 RepID=A0A5N6PXP3_9ASTR|nr:hypothetical protein E3N88_04826 [Mikania micrantha]